MLTVELPRFPQNIINFKKHPRFTRETGAGVGGDVRGEKYHKLLPLNIIDFIIQSDQFKLKWDKCPSKVKGGGGLYFSFSGNY